MYLDSLSSQNILLSFIETRLQSDIAHLTNQYINTKYGHHVYIPITYWVTRRLLISHSNGLFLKGTAAINSSILDSIGAFPLHGMVRYGTAQFGSVCISTAV